MKTLNSVGRGSGPSFPRFFWEGSVVSMAVLADDDPSWRPSDYNDELLKKQLNRRFGELPE